MHGSPPPPSAIPPGVHRARRSPGGRRAWTGLWGGRILGVGLVLAAVAVGVVHWAMRTQAFSRGVPASETTLEPTWGRQTFDYKPVAQPPPIPSPQPVDLVTPELTRLRTDLALLRQEVALLKERPTPVVTDTAPPQAPMPLAPRPRGTPPPLLFVAHEPGKESRPPVSPRREYVLAPGTTLPLLLESAVNSDVPGAFTARISQGVYDSATHRHLLVPQGSLVVGHDQSQALLYGNERLPTIALTLSLPDGRTVELGQAPITDQAGAQGLTGDVNNHYGRLLGAVLIGGVLKGGLQAMSTAVAGQGAETQVAVGITQAGSQVVSSRQGRSLDTRPTIMLHPGQGGTVLLLKPLTLPAFYE